MTPHGFVDLHAHGIGRYDTKTDNPSDILKIAELHAAAGTAAFLAAVYPAPISEMRRNMEAGWRAMQRQAHVERGAGSEEPVRTGQRPEARILGLHLEGPFLNPGRCGALDKESFVKPGLSALRDLIAGYEDIVKVVTVAPELPGALKVIERCRALGMRVNMGHSDATCEEALNGKRAGATGITHLFNAMRPFHHREPGLAGLGLIDEDLYVEIIADRFHLHPLTLELIFSRKRLDRIILVSDAVKNTGRKGIAVYKQGILAGGGSAVAVSFEVLGEIGVPEAEITEAAIDNPARYLGLNYSRA